MLVDNKFHKEKNVTNSLTTLMRHDLMVYSYVTGDIIMDTSMLLNYPSYSNNMLKWLCGQTECDRLYQCMSCNMPKHVCGYNVYAVSFSVYQYNIMLAISIISLWFHCNIVIQELISKFVC